MGNAVKIESLQKFKNSDEKEDGSADAKSLVLQLDCSALMVQLCNFMTVQLQHVCLCDRSPRKKGEIS